MHKSSSLLQNIGLPTIGLKKWYTGRYTQKWSRNTLEIEMNLMIYHWIWGNYHFFWHIHVFIEMLHSCIQQIIGMMNPIDKYSRVTSSSFSMACKCFLFKTKSTTSGHIWVQIKIEDPLAYLSIHTSEKHGHITWYEIDGFLPVRSQIYEYR